MPSRHLFHLIICLFFLGTGLFAQTDLLQHYIQAGLDSNIALKQKDLSFEKSLAALKEAKGLFFPKLSLEARYSVARGGRTIDFPVGDLVNPAYQNLNLLNSIGQATYPDYPLIPEYPTIANEEINFLRETEQETKLRVAMPVFNAAILHNHRIRQNLVEVERMSVDIYKRELVREIKSAYYNYAKAKEAVTLYQNTIILVEENLRTSESLVKNNKATIDVVYAAKAQVESVEQQLAVAEKNEKVAQAYFNFLLNRDYQAGIEIGEDTSPEQAVVSLEEARRQAFQQREEFTQLSHYLSLSDQQIRLQKANYLPGINLVADYGVQGTRYDFAGDADYAMGSLVMSWNLFDAGNKARVQQAKIEQLEIRQQKEAAYQQIGLQVVEAFYELEAAAKSIELAEAEVGSTSQAFRLVNKKFSQGQANLVELTDARTQMTNAGQKLIIARFDYQIKLAEVERATGGYSFR